MCVCLIVAKVFFFFVFFFAARKQADQEPSPMEFNGNEGRELERSKSNGEEGKEKEEEKEEGEEREREWEESPKVSESSSVGVEEEIVEQGNGEPITSENEFILDGFDFSTGNNQSHQLYSNWQGMKVTSSSPRLEYLPGPVCRRRGRPAGEGEEGQ